VTVTPVASSGPEFETSSVYVRGALVAAGSGSANFATDRSAPGSTTVVSSEAVLFDGSGSVAVVLTVAEFVICPVVPGAVTEMTTVAASNAASVPRLHVIVAPGGRQLPWLGVALTGVTPAGSVSVTSTAVAASGPSLATVRV
jgi:hypothetical protein